MSACWSAGSQSGVAGLEQRVFARPYEAVFSDAVRAVRCAGWAVDSRNKEQGRMGARTGVRMRGLGESLTIRVERMADQRIQVSLQSRAGQTLDWGRNEDNVREFNAMLSRIARHPGDGCPDG